MFLSLQEKPQTVYKSAAASGRQQYIQYPPIDNLAGSTYVARKMNTAQNLTPEEEVRFVDW